MWFSAQTFGTGVIKLINYGPVVETIDMLNAPLLSMKQSPTIREFRDT